MTGRILLVDAVPTNRMVLRVRLSAACYDVAQAATGAEALSEAARTRPDLIVLAPTLPDVDGLRLCRQFKADPASADIPVIMITEERDKGARLAALRAGADEFLAKPVDELPLLARVRSLLRARDTERELALREGTWREFGFTEPAAGFTPAGRIALVGREIGKLGAPLAALLPGDRISAMTREQALAGFKPTNSPDIFVIYDEPGTEDALTLLSDLRSRATTRTAVVIIVLGDTAGRAAMALDLGANDIVSAPVDPQELALRVRAQLRRKRQSDRLRASVSDGLRMAVTDPLTGLFNRRYALNHLPRMAHQCATKGRHLALVVIDIDHFKQINDSHGHGVGDQVLAEISARLRANLRDVDMIARIGGDEFLVALPECTSEVAMTAAERLRREVTNAPVVLDRSGKVSGAADISVSVSLGVALRVAQGTQAGIGALMHAADSALYAAKARGRNRAELAPHPFGTRRRAPRLAPRPNSRSKRSA